MVDVRTNDPPESPIDHDGVKDGTAPRMLPPQRL